MAYTAYHGDTFLRIEVVFGRLTDLTPPILYEIKSPKARFISRN